MNSRTIKFRGKKLDNGEWIYGSLLIDTDEHKKHWISDYGVSGTNTYTWEEVDPKTVGQFVGCLDKKEKEIFEGDILAWYHGARENDKGIGPVIFNYGQFEVDNYTLEAFRYGNEQSLEIIGNIHENPEILNV